MHFPSPQFSKKNSINGFSLLELLVAVVIVLIIGLLGFGVTRAVQESSRQTSCATKLRSIGVATHLYSIEHNQRLLLYSLTPATSSSSAKELIWIHTVMPYGLKISDLRCPSMPSTKTSGYVAYGRRAVDDFSEELKHSTYLGASKGGGEIWFYPQRVQEPASYFMIADSLASPTSSNNTIRGEQVYSIRLNGVSAGSAAHSRHNSKANVLFVDGHVEACNGNRLKEIGFKSGYDQEKKSVFW